MDTNSRTTLADRIREAMGGDSAYQASARLQLRGVAITPQAIYEWLKGGDVKEATLVAFADEYKVQPAWLRYGVGPRQQESDAERAVVSLFREMPEQTKQLALDFIEYQLHKSTSLLAGEKMASYMTLISKIKDYPPTPADGGDAEGAAPRP